jgi:hypothetical protein
MQRDPRRFGRRARSPTPGSDAPDPRRARALLEHPRVDGLHEGATGRQRQPHRQPDLGLQAGRGRFLVVGVGDRDHDLVAVPEPHRQRHQLVGALGGQQPGGVRVDRSAIDLGVGHPEGGRERSEDLGLGRQLELDERLRQRAP